MQSFEIHYIIRRRTQPLAVIIYKLYIDMIFRYRAPGLKEYLRNKSCVRLTIPCLKEQCLLKGSRIIT